MLSLFTRALPAVIFFASAGWLAIAAQADEGTPQEKRSNADPFRGERLVAWCIVPFDAEQRTPEQRARMIRRLGMRRVAYDWRQRHVASFEEEARAYRRHGIEFFAFWSWHDAIEPVIRAHGIRPQIWRTCPSPASGTAEQRVAEAARQMLPLVDRTRELGLKLGLYNHGGWGGEPENLIAVCERLRSRHNAPHVGIVYNFHHGHGHIDDFPSMMGQLQPYLLCLNLNGMADPTDVDQSTHRNKILPIGQGGHDRAMIRAVLESGYRGPIGILDHRPEVDAEVALRQNLRGLEKTLNTLR